jgi:hypothetical protein
MLIGPDLQDSGVGGNVKATVTLGAASTSDWTVYQGIIISGTLTTTNCLNLGNSSGFTCNVPSGGGGGSHIIGDR